MIGEKNLQYAAQGLTRKESRTLKIITSCAIRTTDTSPCNPHLSELGEGGVLVLLLEGLQLLPGQVGPVHGQQGLHPEREGQQQNLAPSYTNPQLQIPVHFGECFLLVSKRQDL
jgi:hypothetical protein